MSGRRRDTRASSLQAFWFSPVSISQSVSQTVSQMDSQSVSQRVSQTQTVRQSVRQSDRQTVSQSVGQSAVPTHVSFIHQRIYTKKLGDSKAAKQINCLYL